jgi:hypothetical protein
MSLRPMADWIRAEVKEKPRVDKLGRPRFLNDDTAEPCHIICENCGETYCGAPEEKCEASTGGRPELLDRCPACARPVCSKCKAIGLAGEH